MAERLQKLNHIVLADRKEPDLPSETGAEREALCSARRSP